MKMEELDFVIICDKIISICFLYNNISLFNFSSSMNFWTIVTPNKNLANYFFYFGEIIK